MMNIEQVSMEELNDMIVMQSALVLHSNSTGDKQYMSRHNINSKQELERGVLITHEAVIELLTAKNKTKTKNESLLDAFIPENVLLNTNQQLIWFKPAHRGTFWVREGTFKSTAVYYPAVLFVINKSTRILSLYGLESDIRPTLETILYKYPLPNLYQNNTFCQGSAQLPKSLNISDISKIESTVFESAFTHFHTNSFHNQNDPAQTPNSAMKYFKKHFCNVKTVKISDHVKPVSTNYKLKDLLSSRED